MFEWSEVQIMLFGQKYKILRDVRVTEYAVRSSYSVMIIVYVCIYEHILYVWSAACMMCDVL